MHEIFDAAWAEWKHQANLALILLCVAAFGLALEAFALRRLPGGVRRTIGRVALAAAACVGLYFAWQVLWLGDDAFITFRYAQNFAEGNGLVFNPGEWVEGYTNFLWTLLLGIAGRIGLDIPYTGLFGNLLCFVAALAITRSLVRRTAPDQPVIPWAAVALAGSFAFTTWASSGLETMPVAVLVVAGALASTWRRGALLSGLVLTIACLTRPDHVLIYGCMGLALVAEDLLHRRELVWWKRPDLRRYLAYAAPFVLLYVPYFVWRWQAYGDLYPNTYYAKSGGSSYWSQGLIYASEFVASTGAFAWLVALGVALFGRARNRDETRLRVYAGLSLVVFSHYVIKVGGDFMEHRFFVPLLPLLFATCEVGLRWRVAELRASWSRVAMAAVGAVALVAAVTPIQLLPTFRTRWQLAPEQTFYKITQLYPLEIASSLWWQGGALEKVFSSRGLYPRFAVESVGMIAYRSKLPLVDMLGLTNRRIAHKEIAVRGRPGHEKLATRDEILEEGALVSWWPWDVDEVRQWSRGRVDGIEFVFLRWDKDLFEALGKVDGALIPKPEEDIRRLATSGSRSELLLARYFFPRFLANHPRRDELLAQLEDRLHSVAEFEGELPRVAKIEGGGLHLAQATYWGGQWIPSGVSGTGWLSSLPDSGDGTGTMLLPLGTITEPELRFGLGGAASDEIRVELLVDGKVVRTAAPPGEPGLQPVAWDVAAWEGRTAELRIVDADPTPGHGIDVDAIHWRARAHDVRERLAAARKVEPADIETASAIAATILEAKQVLPEGSWAPPPGWIHWGLDDAWPAGSQVSGTAFTDGPVHRALHQQTAPRNHLGGGLLNSFMNEDSSRGRIAFPEIVLPKGGVHLLVAGGRNCNKVWVGLEVDGKVIARVCGAGDETLRHAVLDPGSYAGRTGHVVVEDRTGLGWGHILVDEIIVPPSVGLEPRAVDSGPSNGSGKASGSAEPSGGGSRARARG